MKVVAIMRHGEAESFAGNDARRELTDRGRLQSRQAGKLLAQHFDAYGGVEAIAHSPFSRTTQTAELVAEEIGGAAVLFGPEPNDALLGDQSVASVSQWLSTQTWDRFIIVSHEPLVGDLLSWLVSGLGTSVRQREHHFQPSTFAMIKADIFAQGCADFITISHH
mgnify:CR=1 FL=1